MNKTIYAWTAPGSEYPVYVNIAQTGENDFVLTVRGQKLPADEQYPYVRPGHCSAISINGAQLLDLRHALMNLVL